MKNSARTGTKSSIPESGASAFQNACCRRAYSLREVTLLRPPAFERPDALPASGRFRFAPLPVVRRIDRSAVKRGSGRCFAKGRNRPPLLRSPPGEQTLDPSPSLASIVLAANAGSEAKNRRRAKVLVRRQSFSHITGRFVPQALVRVMDEFLRQRLVLQPAVSDCLLLDLLSDLQDFDSETEVDVSGGQVGQTLVVALVVVVIDEGTDLSEIAEGLVVGARGARDNRARATAPPRRPANDPRRLARRAISARSAPRLRLLARLFHHAPVARGRNSPNPAGQRGQPDGSRQEIRPGRERSSASGPSDRGSGRSPALRLEPSPGDLGRDDPQLRRRRDHLLQRV